MLHADALRRLIYLAWGQIGAKASAPNTPPPPPLHPHAPPSTRTWSVQLTASCSLVSDRVGDWLATFGRVKNMFVCAAEWGCSKVH